MTLMRKAFKQQIQEALANQGLGEALDGNAIRRKTARNSAMTSQDVDFQQLQARAKSIRVEVLSNLDDYLTRFTQKLSQNGWQIYYAEDHNRAAEILLEIARARKAVLAAKSKSMLSEEICLNQVLDSAGLKVIETDLGEYIVQLRNEPPAHITTPAVHLKKEDVAETFRTAFQTRLFSRVEEMAEFARGKLREVFFTADIGITGVNFGVVESGAICLVTNEGNGRMVSTLPKTHIALMGIERLVPTLEDLDVLLCLLSRSATGQKLTSYTSLIRTPRRIEDPDGPEERILILVDNGRRATNRGDFAEALACIRCGACLNACPVFREIGGHAYHSPYPGPIGSVLNPSLFGFAAYGHLSKASTLCGACAEVCPVGIDFPKLLLRGRAEYVQSVKQPASLNWGIKLFTWIMENPTRYRTALTAAGLASSIFGKEAGWNNNLPGFLGSWTNTRYFPPLALQPFRARLHKQKSRIATKAVPGMLDKKGNAETALELVSHTESRVLKENLPQQFAEQVRRIGGEVYFCRKASLAYLIAEVLREAGVRTLMSAQDTRNQVVQELLKEIRKEGFTVLEPALLRNNPGRQQGLQWLDQAEAGLTGASAGLADTGTLVLPVKAGESQLASLIAPIHIAVLHSNRIFPSMRTWFASEGEKELSESQAVTFVSGPSRTADIEMTLTVGMHGPKKLAAFLLDDD